ncbi:MAG: hypothetical protein V1928_00245 [Parcubacteria group bacterium]
MPKNKILTKTLKINALIKQDRKAVNMIESELHYFKGLSIVIFALFFCVFFVFSALFASMYMEVRMARVALQNALIAQYDSSSSCPDAENQPLVQPEEGWLAFAKYGFEISYPKEWSFLDKPSLKQVNFFQDGKIRNETSTNTGDVTVTLANKDLYSGKYPKTDIQIAGLTAASFEFKIGNVTYGEIVVPFNSPALPATRGREFINIRFKKQIGQNENLSEDTIQKIIEKFQIIKQ